MHSTRQQPHSLDPMPYTGTSAHTCARCGRHEVPIEQQHLGGWNYAYYCCEPVASSPVVAVPKPVALRLVAKPPQTDKVRVKALQAKQEKYRFGGAEIVLEALQAEPLSLDALVEVSRMTRGSTINLITKLRREGKVVTARRRGNNAISWVGIVEHQDRIDAIAQQLADSRPLTENQIATLEYLDGNPASLSTIATALHGGNPDTCRNRLLALKRRGLVTSRKTTTWVSSEVWFCLIDQVDLLDKAFADRDDVDRPAIVRYCLANPGCIEKQIIQDLGLSRDRTRRTLERMLQDGDVVHHTLHRWKRYTLTPQGETVCKPPSK